MAYLVVSGSFLTNWPVLVSRKRMTTASDLGELAIQDQRKVSDPLDITVRTARRRYYNRSLNKEITQSGAWGGLVVGREDGKVRLRKGLA